MSPLRILVVDDDVNCLTSVGNLLALDGHSIYTATGGLEAIEFARQLKLGRTVLDLSILDFNMPDLSGIETFHHLCVDFPRMGCIFISGDASADLEARVLEAGGRALVRKPVDVSRMRSAVREFV